MAHGRHGTCQQQQQLTWLKAAAATRAPTLPAAADKPWKKERTPVGYTSPATSQVVQLGPNCGTHGGGQLGQQPVAGCWQHTLQHACLFRRSRGTALTTCFGGLSLLTRLVEEAGKVVEDLP